MLKGPGSKLVVPLALLTLTCLAIAVGFAQMAKPGASPSDYLLLTIILKHDQSKTLGEINQELARSGFWRAFPPQGIDVESWYVVMGLGQVVTLRVPPSRLREVNLAIEKTAWKAFRTEIYPAYDYKDIARSQREDAAQKTK